MSNDLHLGCEVIRLRLAQQLINEMYKQKQFRIPIHLAMGHEALAAALAAALGPGDRLLPSHRNLHYNLARGASLPAIVDEFLLRPSGLGGGRFGSMNLVNPAAGIVYTSSILGNNLGVAAGVCLAKKLRGDGLAAVVTGDGAMEEGTFYELLVFLAGHWLWNWHHYLVWFHLLLGATYAFHVTLNWHILKHSQTDISDQGYLFSAVIIFLGNVAVLLVGIPLLVSKVGVTTALGWWLQCTGETLHRLARVW